MVLDGDNFSLSLILSLLLHLLVHLFLLLSPRILLSNRQQDLSPFLCLSFNPSFSLLALSLYASLSPFPSLSPFFRGSIFHLRN